MHDHHHTVPQMTTTADGEQVPKGTVIEPGPVWTGVGAHHKLWIDASAGASGDMLLAALIDAGADSQSIAAVLDLVAPGKLRLQTRRVERGPFSALKVDVLADEPNPPHRHLSDIRTMLAHPDIPEATRKFALDAFTRLAGAEATVHGTDIESVHFHEVGALDSIGDIVGVAEALRTLGVDSFTTSTVAVGAGFVDTQHGRLSVPPPAVLELSKGWVVEAGGPPDVGELCTPTGMALLRAGATAVEPMPRMSILTAGVGAGGRDRKDRANVLRVTMGVDPSDTDSGHVTALSINDEQDTSIREISANVDDLDPRVWPAVIDRLLDAGAVDAWLVPILMKKGRPAHTVVALAPGKMMRSVADALLTHTSTIGVRATSPMHRRVLERLWVPIDVEGAEVRIKISGDGPGKTIQQATAEFADVEKLAERLGVSQRFALAQAQSAAWAQGLRPGEPWPSKERKES